MTTKQEAVPNFIESICQHCIYEFNGRDRCPYSKARKPQKTLCAYFIDVEGVVAERLMLESIADP